MTNAVCVVVPAVYAGALSVLLAHECMLPVEPCLDYACSATGYEPASHYLLLGLYAEQFIALSKDRARLLRLSACYGLGWSALEVEDLVSRSRIKETNAQALLWETSLMIVNRHALNDRLAERKAQAA